MMVRRVDVGFTDARHNLLQAIARVQRGEASMFHEPRKPGEADKNLLERGGVTLGDVVLMAKAASAGRASRNYTCAPHDDVGQWPKTNVHILKHINWQGRSWYVKWFYDDVDDLFFISVHPSMTEPSI